MKAAGGGSADSGGENVAAETAAATSKDGPAFWRGLASVGSGGVAVVVSGAADGSADSVTGPGPGAGGDRLAIASQKLKFLGSGE